MVQILSELMCHGPAHSHFVNSCCFNSCYCTSPVQYAVIHSVVLLLVSKSYVWDTNWNDVW